MTEDKYTTAGIALRDNATLILKEHQLLQEQIDYEQVAKLIPLLKQAPHIFVIGVGRSGLALKAAAMRFMHIGLPVFVAGETTTPAIQKGDLLLAASGSGSTGTVVLAAEKAHGVGANVIAISTTEQSKLAALSLQVVVLPAAQKQDFGNHISQQYAGSLFEQAVLLMMDAIFHALWQQTDIPAEQLWKRHANLE